MDVPVGAQRPFWVGIEPDSAQPVRRVTYGAVSTGSARRLAWSNYGGWWSWRRVVGPAPGGRACRDHVPGSGKPLVELAPGARAGAGVVELVETTLPETENVGGRPCRPPDA